MTQCLRRHGCPAPPARRVSSRTAVTGQASGPLRSHGGGGFVYMELNELALTNSVALHVVHIVLPKIILVPGEYTVRMDRPSVWDEVKVFHMHP